MASSQTDAFVFPACPQHSLECPKVLKYNNYEQNESVFKDSTSRWKLLKWGSSYPCPLPGHLVTFDGFVAALDTPKHLFRWPLETLENYKGTGTELSCLLSAMVLGF